LIQDINNLYWIINNKVKNYILCLLIINFMLIILLKKNVINDFCLSLFLCYFVIYVKVREEKIVVETLETIYKIKWLNWITINLLSRN
jgi:hypothetical protein